MCDLENNEKMQLLEKEINKKNSVKFDDWLDKEISHFAFSLGYCTNEIVRNKNELNNLFYELRYLEKVIDKLEKLKGSLNQ